MAVVGARMGHKSVQSNSMLDDNKIELLVSLNIHLSVNFNVLTTDSQNEITDKKKSLDLVVRRIVLKIQSWAKGRLRYVITYMKKNLQILLLADDNVSVATDVKFNSNLSTKLKQE
jgi:hypothetical protein